MSGGSPFGGAGSPGSAERVSHPRIYFLYRSQSSRGVRYRSHFAPSVSNNFMMLNNHTPKPHGRSRVKMLAMCVAHNCILIITYLSYFQVTVVARVVSIKSQATNSVYWLDDSTRRIEARRWHDAQDSDNPGSEEIKLVHPTIESQWPFDFSSGSILGFELLV